MWFMTGWNHIRQTGKNKSGCADEESARSTFSWVFDNDKRRLEIRERVHVADKILAIKLLLLWMQCNAIWRHGVYGG